MSVWGALVGGRASGAAALGGSVQGAAKWRNKQLLRQTREIQEMWYFTVQNFC